MQRFLTFCVSAGLLFCGGLAAPANAATVTVKGTVIQPACNLNGGTDILVDFGEVVISKIDGQSYARKPLNYTLSCEADTPPLKMTISGTGASFGSGLLVTNQNGLGIQFQNGTTNLPLNSGEVKFNYGESTPDLWAVPAKNPSVNLNTGAFSATATLAIDYQ